MEAVAEPEELTPEKMTVMSDAVQEQNEKLIEKLQLIGKAPTQQLLRDIAFETLLQLLFQSPEERQAYDVACHISLNRELKSAIVGFSNQLVIPGVES